MGTYSSLESSRKGCSSRWFSFVQKKNKLTGLTLLGGYRRQMSPWLMASVRAGLQLLEVDFSGENCLQAEFSILFVFFPSKSDFFTLINIFSPKLAF